MSKAVTQEKDHSKVSRSHRLLAYLEEKEPLREWTEVYSAEVYELAGGMMYMVNKESKCVYEKSSTEQYWECVDTGRDIKSKTRRISIHDGPGDAVGSGRTKGYEVPYCPFHHPK